MNEYWSNHYLSFFELLKLIFQLLKNLIEFVINGLHSKLMNKLGKNNYNTESLQDFREYYKNDKLRNIFAI